MTKYSTIKKVLGHVAVAAASIFGYHLLTHSGENTTDPNSVKEARAIVRPVGTTARPMGFSLRVSVNTGLEQTVSVSGKDFGRLKMTIIPDPVEAPAEPDRPFELYETEPEDSSTEEVYRFIRPQRPELNRPTDSNEPAEPNRLSVVAPPVAD